jgi:hypothetical protein
MKQTADRQRDEHLELPFKFASQTAREKSSKIKMQNKNLLDQSIFLSYTA